MRRGFGLPIVGSLVLVVALAGCKNQAAGTFTNPFLTPDRVPPPSTRVLAPGTAQPYYPGDPVPGAAPTAGAPVIGAPVATPGYSPTPTYTTPPATTGYPTTPPMTTPPGGWGSTFTPQSNADTTAGFNGDAVNVPVDQQGLRFASAEATGSFGQSLQADVNGPAAPSLPSIRLPIQSILPLGGADDAAASQPSRLAAREVSAAEYFAPPGGVARAQLASAEVGRDGFRPQGSTQRVEPPDSDDAFRPPSIRGAATSKEVASRFAAGDNYESLRGQLEYWPASGEWSLRYVAEGAPADALGGRMMIDNPQVLANLQPGEMVTVRGQAFTKSTESGAVQPAYRVSAVQRQRL